MHMPALVDAGETRYFAEKPGICPACVNGKSKSMARTPNTFPKAGSARTIRAAGKFPRGKAAEAFLLELADRQAAERAAENPQPAPAQPEAPDPADNPLRRKERGPKSAVRKQGDGVVVLGVDPGSQCTGWGVLREVSGVLTLLDCGAIRPKGADFSARLAHLFKELSAVVARYAPDEAAVEDVHVANNAMSALKLGQARGVVVAACAAHGIPVFDWRPTAVKKAVTGSGGADKEQVAWMVAKLLNTKLSGPADMTDALAVAVCHLNQRKLRGMF